MYSLFCSAISSDVLSFPFCRLFWSNAINETKREHTGRCCALLFLMEKLICFPLLCSDALLYSTILILYPSSLSVLLSDSFLLPHALLKCCYFRSYCLLVYSTHLSRDWSLSLLLSQFVYFSSSSRKWYRPIVEASVGNATAGNQSIQRWKMALAPRPVYKSGFWWEGCTCSLLFGFCCMFCVLRYLLLVVWILLLRTQNGTRATV